MRPRSVRSRFYIESATVSSRTAWLFLEVSVGLSWGAASPSDLLGKLDAVAVCASGEEDWLEGVATCGPAMAASTFTIMLRAPAETAIAPPTIITKNAAIVFTLIEPPIRDYFHPRD